MMLGNFDWASPDEEVHAFIIDLVRPVGTHLYGRRMYETMVAWERPAHSRWTSDAPLHTDLASGRQDRVLDDARRGHECEDAPGARLRPRSGRRLKASSKQDISSAVRLSRRRRSQPAWSTSAPVPDSGRSSAASTPSLPTGLPDRGSSWIGRVPLRVRRRAAALPLPAGSPDELLAPAALATGSWLFDTSVAGYGVG